MGDNLNKAREALTVALDEFESAVEAVGLADDDGIEPAEERALKAEAEVERRQKIVAQIEKVNEARKAAPIIATDDDDDGEVAEQRARITVGKEEATYRPDTNVSFFRDLYYAGRDREARERLERHGRETEKRDMTTGAGSGAGYLPPVYLTAFETPLARAGGPLLSALPKAPLPASGTSFTVPRVTTGSTVAAQNGEGTSVSEQDLVTDQLTTNVRTIAGQVDISQQLLDRSDPAFDTVIASDLASAYTTEFDRQLINGLAANAEHVGLLNVASINSVTYTEATPTSAGFLPKIYKAIENIASNRFMFPTHMVMHPRRASFLAAGLSSTFPLFQQGGLNQAAGTQDIGVVGTIAGLPVVVDANIPTTLGTGTDEDAILVIHAPDLRVMEGATRFRAMEQPLSADLEVRLQLFGYSAFLSGRYPKGIAAITGTALNEVL